MVKWNGIGKRKERPMGYLDDYVNNASKVKKRRPLKSIPKLIALIRSGEYDPSDPRHVRMRNVALKYGYIDEDMNVLKGGWNA